MGWGWKGGRWQGKKEEEEEEEEGRRGEGKKGRSRRRSERQMGRRMGESKYVYMCNREKERVRACKNIEKSMLFTNIVNTGKEQFPHSSSYTEQTN